MSLKSPAGHWCQAGHCGAAAAVAQGILQHEQAPEVLQLGLGKMLLCESGTAAAGATGWTPKPCLAPARGALLLAVYHAIYLEELTAVELTEKLAQLFSISSQQISQIYKQGPTGIHVLISDEVTASGCSSFPASCTGLLQLV